MTNSTSAKSSLPSNAPSHLNSKDYPPKLTSDEGSLLVNNHGCTKYCRAYIFHTKFDCLNNFPKGTGYKTITQATIDTAHHLHEAKSKKPVGAIAPGNMNTAAGPSLHPVAVVMGHASNPIGYTANYSSAVLSGDDSEDELDSSQVCAHVTAIIENIDDTAPTVSNLPKADSDLVAPLTVPHLFWHASASLLDSLPLQFNCLLDIGSHLVIIHEQLVNDLGLCH